VIKLSDIAQQHNIRTSNTPTNGGLWYDAHNKEAVPFVGFDPDVKMNSFTYDKTLKEYTLIGDFYDSNLQILKGPSHVGQLRPAGVKAAAKTMKRCTTLSKPVIYNGVTTTTTDGETVKHRTYVEIMWREVIDRGMHCEFLVPDSGCSDGWDLFYKHSHFTLSEVKNHVAQQITKADVFQYDNYQWSGQLIMSSFLNYKPRSSRRLE
jgi:hypothetical protein